MSYFVTNKWMKAGYGKPLRQFFKEEAWVESVVDFGHAKQIFPDADVFPSIIVARKPTAIEAPETARLCTIPREQLRIDDLSRQIEMEGDALPLEQLNAESWQLEPAGVTQLMEKIADHHLTLDEYAKVKPLTGIKTAFNKAYLIDGPTKSELVSKDPNCASIVKPYLRGADIDRWCVNSSDQWMIVIPSSGDFEWPWAQHEEQAESTFRRSFPSLYEHMKKHETALRKRSDQGRYWWELRSCAYWDQFKRKKIYYQLIQYHPCFAFDVTGLYGNNKTAFIPSDDLYLLAVLNSPLMWWYNWRYLPHMKDEALAPNPTVLEYLPIANPAETHKNQVVSSVEALIENSSFQRDTSDTILDWLRVEHDIEKPSRKLQSLTDLDSDEFVAEVKRIRGRKNPLSAAALKSLRDEYGRTITPARVKAAEGLKLERQLSDLVNEAYGLTPEEVELMWKTAPPRMPIQPPES